jgi:hypothetical protein
VVNIVTVSFTVSPSCCGYVEIETAREAETNRKEISMGFMDKAKQAAEDAKKEGGLLDKAKKAKDQAAAKIDEKQKQFNDRQSQDAQERHEAAQAAQGSAQPQPPQPPQPENAPPPASPGQGGAAPAQSEPEGQPGQS